MFWHAPVSRTHPASFSRTHPFPASARFPRPFCRATKTADEKDASEDQDPDKDKHQDNNMGDV